MTKSQAVRIKAEELAAKTSSPQEISRRIALFVQDQIPYCLDEWDLGAEEVLHKKQGMCSGKALLAAELHRVLEIPTRFKVTKILGEEGLTNFVAQCLDEDYPEFPPGEIDETLSSIRSLSAQRDHIVVQVYLDGKWADLDLALDRDLEQGMRLIGMHRGREVLSEEGPYDSLNGWLKERMRRRAVTQERQIFFKIINHHIEQIRHLGRLAGKAGIQAWTETEIRDSLAGWNLIPGCPACAGMTAVERLDEVAKRSKAALSRSADPIKRASLETKMIDWLYALVRRNIKRGRFWELSDVLTQRGADCLGYARLLSFLANDFGLASGVIEVVQDNRGAYVPHYVCMANLADGQKRYIDPWYGSANVRHRLLMARVYQNKKFLLKELTIAEIESASEVRGLRPEELAGISFYILGNSYLAQGKEKEAIECYDASLHLYPANPRTLFNRAVALERIHEEEQAQVAYQRAFATSSSPARILARVEEIEPLIELDEKGIQEPEQQVYLLRKGFITGQEEEWEEIARRCKATAVEMQTKFNSIMIRLGN